MSRACNVFERGTTRTDRPHLLGRPGYFDHTGAPAARGPQSVLSGQEVETLVVMNDSGGTLAPGKIVTWKAGYAGTRVGGLGAAATPAAGVVDPFLTAAVANGAHFHLIRKGPTQVEAHDGSIVAGDRLVTAASGRADTQANDQDADVALAFVGIANGASAAQDDMIDALVNFNT